MATTQVLLLGGHGKVALHLTPLLLAKSWNVTSVIRNPDQKSEILKLGQGQPGKVDVLIESLDEVKSDADAQKVLNQVKPQIVVWAAGAGGKGGASRTLAVDRDAAKHYITTSLAASSVRKFMMVSYIGSRHGRAPWWTEDDIQKTDHTNQNVLPTYFQAKVDADEHLVAMAEKRRRDGDSDFQAINLRPGTLTDDPATGKVKMGKTPTGGKVTREDVALVAAALLERNDTRGYFDLLGGDTPIKEAVDQLVKENHNGMEGEDMDKIFSRI